MEPVLLELITEELERAICGGVISRVEQPDGRTLVLRIFLRGAEQRLLISAEHGLSRVHLTASRYANPPSPLRFCAYLRSRITGARITRVSQVPGERIVMLTLEKRAGGRIVSHTLVAELTGKSSNIILKDSRGVVEDALRYFPHGSLRPVLPGEALADLPAPAAAVAPGTGPGIERSEEETWNEAADTHYSALVRAGTLEARRRTLAKAVRAARKRLERKLENLARDRERAAREREYTALGELLKTGLGRLKRGMREALVMDYTRVPPARVKVELDERLTPRENMERYFKRGRKARVALALLEKRIPRVAAELEHLSALALDLEEAGDERETEAVAEVLVSAGYMKGRGRASEERGRAGPVRRAVSSEGFEVVCGKSAAGNDLIVRRLARPHDLWLHASGVSGSHVLIKTAGRAEEMTEKTITEAAAWAAWHSKARDEKKAAVVYTDATNVRKPRGAPPGEVVLDQYKTMLVTPADMEKKGA